MGGWIRWMKKRRRGNRRRRKEELVSHSPTHPPTVPYLLKRPRFLRPGLAVQSELGRSGGFTRPLQTREENDSGWFAGLDEFRLLRSHEGDQLVVHDFDEFLVGGDALGYVHAWGREAGGWVGGWVGGGRQGGSNELLDSLPFIHQWDLILPTGTRLLPTHPPTLYLPRAFSLTASRRALVTLRLTSASSKARFTSRRAPSDFVWCFGWVR